MNAFAVASYKSLNASNNSELPCLKSKATVRNQFPEPKQRLMRSAGGISGDNGYLTNGASSDMSSPINVLCNFLKTYLISNAMISINKLFVREQKHLSNHIESSEIQEEKMDPTEASSPRATVTVKAVVNSVDVELTHNGATPTIVLKSHNILSDNFGRQSNCLKPFLLSDHQEMMSRQSIQVPELNCSLLLADLVTRTITGNKHKSEVDKCWLSPLEVVNKKINDGMVRRESDVKQNLQRLLSEKENNKINSWRSKFDSCAKSVFQFLGLVGKKGDDEYVQDIRNLFA